MKLPRPAFCPAFRRRSFSRCLSTSGCPSCGAFASAGCAAAPANRTLCSASKRLFDAGSRLRDFRATRFERIRCRREHDSGGRLSRCTGRISGHCSDFLCAVLRGSDDCFARLRRHGSDHCCRLHWTIGETMPDARASSLALHQAYVIDGTGLLAPVSGCSSARRLDFARCASSEERGEPQCRSRAVAAGAQPGGWASARRRHARTPACRRPQNSFR